MARFVTVLAVAVVCLGWNLPDHAATRGGSGQRVFAACMREHGFRYVTDPPPSRLPQVPSRWERAKYGYYVFAPLVYPEDPRAGATYPADPNQTYVAALSHTQQEAYGGASQACYAGAAKALWHVNVTSVSDHFQRYAAALAAAKTRQLDGDPRLVSLARSYAGCMATRGFPLSTARPSSVDDAEKRRFERIADRLARMQFPGATRGLFYVPLLPPGEARPYLREEIRSAVADEDCGRAFHEVYEPRLAGIRRQVEAAWGVPGL